MSPIFTIKEHTIEAAHIREYARATANAQDEKLWLHVKEYIPVDNPSPQKGDVTIVGGHANGFPKELYEPLWEDFYHEAKRRNLRIRSIIIADAAWQGQSGVINKDSLGNDRRSTLSHYHYRHRHRLHLVDTSSFIPSIPFALTNSAISILARLRSRHPPPPLHAAPSASHPWHRALLRRRSPHQRRSPPPATPHQPRPPRPRHFPLRLQPGLGVPRPRSHEHPPP
ncbi:hypothetical protein G7046_g7392 [Stylonectria norvegica]|nr:hypothetical protein G7046_g7392 [Stylonectria norvegica]